ncbi:MAG: sensor histidine kinase [Lachnospirales bacterium]
MKKTKMKINKKITILFFILVIIPYIVLIFSVYYFFRQHAIKSYGENMVTSLTTISSQIHETLKKYEKSTMSLYHGKAVELLEGGVDSNEINDIEKSLNNIMYSNNYILNVYLTSGNTVVYSGKGGNYNITEIMNPHLPAIKSASGSSLWYYSQDIKGTFYDSYILARDINGKNEKSIGKLYVVIRAKMIRSVYKNITNVNSYDYIVNKDGDILFSSIGEYDEFNLDISTLGNKGYYSTEYLNEECAVAYKYSWDEKWYHISILPLKTIYQSHYTLNNLIILISSIYILFLIIMIIILKKNIFVPMKILSRALEDFGRGDFNTKLDRGYSYEFDNLIDKYNYMIDAMKSLLEEKETEEKEKNNFKLKSIVNQLTPHFLYNSLSTIKWMAVINNQKNIKDFTEALINLLKEYSKIDDDEYTLKDELDFISNYIIIQKTRFMNFETSYDIKVDLKKIKIKKFLLQPIVENSIIHGFNGQQNNIGIIYIGVYKKNNILKIVIEDNGVGFDINKKVESTDHVNIGIKYIKEMITIEYGKDSKFEIYSEMGVGTKVTYLIPLERG